MAELDEAALLGDGNEQHDGPIDENALLDGKELKEEDIDDLYDEAIAPTNSTESAKPVSPTITTVTAPTAGIGAKPATSSEGRKYCCYVGNLLWYTTDADLLKALQSTGLARSQFADMKFFENRTNGQSKGYALLVLNSDAAVKQTMEILPTKTIHGQSPTVLSYNKTNQAKLEDAQAKNQTRPDVKKKGFEEGCVNMGTIRIGAGGQTGRTGTSVSGRSGPPPLMMQQVRPTPLMSQPTSLPSNLNQAPQMRLQINGQQVPLMNRAPVPQQTMLGNGPLGGMNQQIQQQPQMMMGQQVRPMMQTSMGIQPMMGMNAPPPMNNQFQNSSRPPQLGSMGVQPLMQMNTAMRPPINGLPPVHVNPQMFPGLQGTVLSDAEFEDVMTRNQTVSSSAIARAITDASVGDIKGASETILTAIQLIKNSRIGHDERCRQLVYGLEHTLKGLESKGYSSRSKSHRDRSRSRERDRKRRRRSRTRSRSYSRSPSPRRRRY
ncbi:RRM domain-containing protein [Caenorhabditis elegans]|uniref:RRM domain-containing protein n=1 Tax=Caenorhabditis elegans TaxID=6239 RepID=C6KRJ2_CAEEL|nr:RRM domain-containing protein [Caenorhabditis elegans]CAZ65481.1 RRM domain-containing protein [Caenorhabditis elegans]|eukprot:NP_001255354.1 Cleavage Factor IM (CFIm) homolog [Caenorhabditis elegans]